MSDSSSLKKELILYLEPTPNSPLRIQVDTFINDSKTQFYPTTACKYNCHCTMTGFFTVPDSNMVLQNIIHLLDKLIHHSSSNNDDSTTKQSPTVNTTPLLVKKPKTILLKESNTTKTIDQYPVHLLLPVDTPKRFHALVCDFASELATITDHDTIIRPKAMNHISLAYWDEPHATHDQTLAWHRLVLEEQLMDRMYQAACDTFNNDTNSIVDWDLVLYERTCKGVEVGSRHHFVEWGRWPASTSP